LFTSRTKEIPLNPPFSKGDARSFLAAVFVFAWLFFISAPARAGDLGVCADPNNLPFSNQKGEGFENRIAELIGSELGKTVHYTWWAQRRGFVRNTLREQLCDVIIGVPAGFELVLPTKPYYRSSYVFVTRSDVTPAITSFDDPRLHTLRIGVHLIGDDGANTPPAHALVRRGIVTNVAGYMIYGDYNEPDPPARLIEAVAQKAIDVAVAWGPLAGYFAPKQSVPLKLTPVSPALDPPALPMTFAIAMGVRKDDKALRDALNDVIEKRRADIEKILDEYRMVRVTGEPVKKEQRGEKRSE
jgi:mxaJ protein